MAEPKNPRRKRAQPRTDEERTGNPDAGSEKLDPDRTPGDGTLQGSTPAGLTVDELLDRAEAPGQTNDTGTG
ncbi:hypothetical protein [Arenibaculum sp.]|uniref:hypothetical protein n=1 Tax=Arenibaculum sp. TaxID=2865862 RepID=UPI002E1245C1|nr:hypothetical protein [Arenibaculum sp.]